MFAIAECGGLIQLNPTKKREQKVILSPPFHHLYPNSANCLWTVVGRYALLSAHITVHTAETQHNHDFLKIFESLSGSSVVHTYTGILESVDRFKVKSVPGLTVQLLSEKNVALKGFKITIKAMEGGEQH